MTTRLNGYLYIERILSKYVNMAPNNNIANIVTNNISPMNLDCSFPQVIFAIMNPYYFIILFFL